MNYRALIQNRKSVRAFTHRTVSLANQKAIRTYFRSGVKRLIPEIRTQLYLFDAQAQRALEGAAGYENFLIGAPHYMVILSEKHEQAYLNAGYVMEDMILKLLDMGIDSCHLTFADGEKVKSALGVDSPLQVAAIAAFGYGEKSVRRMQVNIRSMSDIDMAVRRQYMEPRRSLYDLAYLGTWGNTHRLDEFIGFYDDVLWEALYAVTLAPSYLNRQAYGLLLEEGSVSLIERPDEFNTRIDSELSMGAALLHLTAVAAERGAQIQWRFDPDIAQTNLPKGHRLVAAGRL